LGSGAYNNYYKAARDAKSNPRGYAIASDAIAQALNDGGYPSSWLQPVLELVARESSFNSNAKNPKSSAYGLFQFLDSTRKNYGGNKVNWSDPYQQAVAGLKYIKDRYGTPEKALEFWDKNKWY
jgi:SLT domain-containing protein